MQKNQFSCMPVILDIIAGSIIAQLFINTKSFHRVNDTYHIAIDTIYTNGGHIMYWKQDTLWKDENHTVFLKVYPKKLLR